MSHHFDTQLAARDPRLNVANAYLFDAAPDRTVLMMTCSADAALSTPADFHPAALYEFRFDTTGDGRDDTAFQVRFTDPIQRAGQGPCQEFTVHYVTGLDLAVDTAECIAGKPVFSAGLNTARRVGAIHGFAGLVGDMWAADAFAVSTMLRAFHVDRRFEEPASANRCGFDGRRNALAIVLEVPNALIGQGQMAMWSSISLYAHTTKAQVSRFGTPLFTQLFLSSWRQPLIERYNKVGPERDIELFAEPVRRFVAEFSALAGLGRISGAYAAGVTAQLIPTVLPYTLGSAAMFTTETINGRPLGTDAFDVMVSLAAGRSLGDGVAPDLSRLRSVFPYYWPPYTAAEQGACWRCRGAGSRCERNLRRASTAVSAMCDAMERCLPRPV
jgi:hypothetical protein